MTQNVLEMPTVEETYRQTLDPRVQSEDSILLASKIVVRNGSMPTRIVMRKVGKEYIVHDEYLTTDKPRHQYGCWFIHHSFGNGSYFPYERVANHTSEADAAKAAFENYKIRSGRL